MAAASPAFTPDAVGQHRAKRVVQDLVDDVVSDKMDFQEEEAAAATVLLNSAQSEIVPRPKSSLGSVSSTLPFTARDVAEAGIVIWH